MRNKSILFGFGLVASSILASPSQLSTTDLKVSDWHELGDANWHFQDGVYTADRGQGYLVSKENYDNFHLKVEFRPESNTNSGLFFRCEDAAVPSDKSCYEANIFDTRPDPIYRTGGIVNIAPPKKIIATEGQWNTYEVWADSSHLTVKLNGEITVDTFATNHHRGPIALQFMAGKISFRNFTISPLPSSQSESAIDGVWQLTAFELEDDTGKRRPWCEGAFGTIIYTQGYMTVAINCTSQPEKRVFYSGPFSLEGDSVSHYVQNYHDASLLQLFRRQALLSNENSLELIGPFGTGGKVIVSWKRR